MRIAIAELDPIVGAFEHNCDLILDAYQWACAQGARMLVTPELSVCGYPPHDLLDRPEIFERTSAALEKLTTATIGKSTALIVGHVARNPEPTGRAAQNCVSVLASGRLEFTQAKTLLPTYDVFDEARYFEPARETRVWQCDGHKIALAICEDLWGLDPAFGRKLYGVDPVESYAKLGAELVISVSASPYEWNKRAHREDLHCQIAQKLGVPLLYVNQSGATDEILFDGASFALSAQGVCVSRVAAFTKARAVFEYRERSWCGSEVSEPLSEIEALERALISGIQEYFKRTGFKCAVLGLSGGIDSAVVATLAQRALGPESVLGVAMPSQYSSSHSLEDAEDLARRLGIRFEVRPIKFTFAQLSRELAQTRTKGELKPIALENLQSRIRGMILMTLANHENALVLTTGNKSELAMGYCTMYGDMVGALAVIGDLFKTRVYALARHLNLTKPTPIPERSISKEPSAELRPNQKDVDSLPPYEELDPILEQYLESRSSVRELIQKYGPEVASLLKTIELNEYKRRQAAPVLKISSKAFGIGRRVPIAKQWDQKL